jgi:hypothetical protein
MSEQLEARLHELRRQAGEFANAEADRVYLNHYRKSKLAMLMKDREVAGVSTVAAQERDARANPEYLELLEGLREATKVAEKNKWLLNIAMRGSSLYQTEEATKRAEIAAYNSKAS